jgi:RNA polymerase sigma-70 factor (ECF subfamily)
VSELRVADAELVSRASSGVEAARAMLFERHGARVLALLIRLLNSRADAEDAAQDAFLEAFRDLPRLRDPAGFGAWVTRIAVSHAHRRFRKRKLLGLLGFTSELDAPLDTLADSRERSESRAELALLQSRLDALPSVERSAWMLRFVEGYELTEVAELLGLSLATVKRKLDRARRALDDAHDFAGSDA